MGKMTICGLSPHPPLLIPEVGKGNRKHVSNTDESLKQLAEKVVATEPDALIVITPHNQVSYDAVPILYGDKLQGDFSRFGAPEVKLNFKYDKELADILIQGAQKKSLNVLQEKGGRGLFAASKSLDMDHGSGVPLYYLDNAGLDVPVVIIGLSLLDPWQLYEYGKVFATAIEESSYNVAVIVSGDLSHALSQGGPAGYNPRGEEFDEKLVQGIKDNDVDAIMDMDKDLVADAAECGYRPLIIALGMLYGKPYSSHVYSYEGPFGVGYAVAEFVPESTDKKLNENLSSSEPVRLARKAVEVNVTRGTIIKPPSELSGILKEKAGVFVSLKKNGNLRGCIGTISPTCSNVAEEIITNAINAATQDPRFGPVKPNELKDIKYSVDILGSPEPVKSIEELDPKKYGVIVSKGMRRGLLLPDLEGVDTASKQVAVACKKAGLRPDESGIELSRFIVKRYN